MKELLYRYNPWWEKGYNINLVGRDNAMNEILNRVDNKQIVFLTGLRRVGKTSIMKLMIDNLINTKGIKPQYVLYVSLDDYQLIRLSIIEIIEEYRKIHRIKFNEHIYVFLDEITYKENYQLQLKNIYDLQKIKIFASSSSASLLKSKKAELTGRNFVYELLPLDFDEYLKFKKVKITQADKHLSENYFEEFLNTGGIPEYVLNNEIAYINELVDDIIYKDIGAIHNIRNINILKDYFMLLMERSGKVLSINKIAAILQISVDTAKRYLDMFADTYLIHLVSRYGKTNERLISPKKIYAADTGIRTSFTGLRDKGSLFENYIFLQLKKYKPSYIYKDNSEIDFMTENKFLIEAKYHDEELSDKQQKLFNEIKAKGKFVIRNNDMLKEVLAKMGK